MPRSWGSPVYPICQAPARIPRDGCQWLRHSHPVQSSFVPGFSSDPSSLLRQLEHSEVRSDYMPEPSGEQPLPSLSEISQHPPSNWKTESPEQSACVLPMRKPIQISAGDVCSYYFC